MPTPPRFGVSGCHRSSGCTTTPSSALKVDCTRAGMRVRSGNQGIGRKAFVMLIFPDLASAQIWHKLGALTGRLCPASEAPRPGARSQNATQEDSPDEDSAARSVRGLV